MGHGMVCRVRTRCRKNYCKMSLLPSVLFVTLFLYMQVMRGIPDAFSLRYMALRPNLGTGIRSHSQTTSKTHSPSSSSSPPSPPSLPSSRRPLLSNATTTKSVGAGSIKVLTAFKGRLGNHMFTFASVYGLMFTTKYTAEENREIGELKFLYKADCEARLYFQLKSHLVEEYSNETWIRECNNTKNELVKDSCAYSSAILEYNKAHRLKTRCFTGFLQSFKYFQPVQDQIRSLFTFKDTIDDVVHREFANINKHFSITSSTDVAYVGMHVRRGDFLERISTVFGRVVADQAYLSRAMAYLTQRLSGQRLVFVVASQDQVWTRANINQTRYNVWFSEGHNAGEDLALLTHCNHSLLTVGSYGWWSAYLKDQNTAITVYMRKNAANGSMLEKIVKAEDYFLPDWVPL